MRVPDTIGGHRVRGSFIVNDDLAIVLVDKVGEYVVAKVTPHTLKYDEWASGAYTRDYDKALEWYIERISQTARFAEVLRG